MNKGTYIGFTTRKYDSNMMRYSEQTWFFTMIRCKFELQYKKDFNIKKGFNQQKIGVGATMGQSRSGFPWLWKDLPALQQKQEI